MNKAELLAIGKEIVGLMIDDVKDTSVELDPNKISEAIESNLFSFKFLFL